MSEIFLSYGRGDDEAYVRSLYGRLKDEGYDAWFDRDRMPSRALTFLQEIRDAVRASDRLVVVLGPAAVRSEYVRAEWQAALVEGKVVTPVLRVGDYDLVPPELANLHCPDVRASRPAADGFQELLRILREPVPALGTLRGAVPEMPPHFQPRPDDLSALAGTLLYDIEHPAVIEGPLRTTVLHGMGGVGKSVLASAFARSTTSRRVFGDGILWAGATPSSSALELVRGLLALTGSPLPADVELPAAVSALRDWLAARRCLIVVDNVWHIEQVAPITQALSTVSRLLLTTRDAGLATSLGSNARALDVLSPDAALRHLADWVETSVEALPREALDVAKETGYLPLALALQGALARDGVAWSDLLQALRDAELDFAEQRFPDYPYPHVLAALRVSVDVLRGEDADAAARFVALAAFLWDGGVPEAAVTRYWAFGDGGLAEHRGRKLLVTLERKALLRLEGQQPLRRVRLHDLMVDFLAAVGDAAAGNRRLLDAYRAACADDWTSGPDDGYFLEHLLDHLARLPDDGAELHRLLHLENAAGRHAWFETIDAAGRVDPLRRQLSHRLAEDTTAAPEAARLALLLGSVTALAGTMPPALLDALVRGGIWPAARALDYARQLPLESQRSYRSDAGLRLRALLAVAPHLPDPERRAVVLEKALAAASTANESMPGLPELATALAAAGRLEDALTVARRTSHGDARTSALGGVAAHAEPDARAAILAEAIGHCANTGELFRAAALAPLLPLLDVEGVRSVRAAAVAPMTNAIARGWCEQDLAQRAAALGAVADALEIAGGIEDRVSRVQARAGSLDVLDSRARAEALDAVIETCREVDEERWRADIAASFADLPPMLETIVPVLFRDQSWRPAVLGAIAGALDDARRSDVIAMARTMHDPVVAVEAIAAIAPSLEPTDRADLVAHGMALLRTIEAVPARARATAALVPLIEPAERDVLVGEALDAVGRGGPADRRTALASLAGAITTATLPRLLDIVGTLEDGADRSMVAERLASAIDAASLPAVKAAIGSVGDRDELLLAAAALAKHAGSDRQRTLLDLAAHHDDYVRARALALLAPHLEDALLPEALAVVDTIEYAGSLAEVALPAFARRAEEPLRTEFLRRAIVTAAAITDAERLSWAFEAFIDLLSPALLDEALAAFAAAEHTFGEEWQDYGAARYRAVAVTRLDPGSRERFYDEVLARSDRLSDARLRRDLLSLLAQNGDPARFGDIVDRIEAEADPYERGISAGLVVHRAPALLRARLVDAALAQVGDIEGDDFSKAGERMEAVVSRIMPYTHDSAYALDMVARMGSQSWRRAALLQYAGARQPALFDETLRQAATLEDAGDRAQVLTALAEAGPAERRAAILGDAIDAALRDRSELLHDNVLPPLAKALAALPAASARAIWHARRSRMGELARPEQLRKLHGLGTFLVDATPAAATATVDAILDVRRWWP